MKLLVTSDPHQRDFKWSKLASAVRKEKPDIVCVAGDLVSNLSLFDYKNFIGNTLVKYAKEIKEVCPYLILIPGNDDHIGVSEYLSLSEWANDLWYNAHDRVIPIMGMEFTGVPYVLDHPFANKTWCVREADDDLRLCSRKIGNYPPCTTVMDNNRYVDIPDYHQFLRDRPSMQTVLDKLSSRVKDISKSVWLIHNPPSGCRLDVTSHGDLCGSKSVLDFIIDKQPLLTLHGHIHESPHYSGKWHCQVNNSIAIQAGQIENDLYYVMVEIEDGKIVRLTHSIYGKETLWKQPLL